MTAKKKTKEFVPRFKNAIFVVDENAEDEDDPCFNYWDTLPEAVEGYSYSGSQKAYTEVAEYQLVSIRRYRKNVILEEIK